MSIVFKKVRITRTVTQAREAWVQCDDATKYADLKGSVESRAVSYDDEWDQLEPGSFGYRIKVLPGTFPDYADDVSIELTEDPLVHVEPPDAFQIPYGGRKWITNGHLLLRDDAPRPTFWTPWRGDLKPDQLTAILSADYPVKVTAGRDSGKRCSIYTRNDGAEVAIDTRYASMIRAGCATYQDETWDTKTWGGVVQVRHNDGSSLMFIMPIRLD